MVQESLRRHATGFVRTALPFKEELLASKDTTLDPFLWPVIRRADTAAPEAYRRAVESLPISGRPEQLSTLISYLGRKHFGG